MTSKQRRVYLTLCEQAMIGGSCPTVRTLAALLGLSVSNTHRYLAQLAARRYVQLPAANRKRVKILIWPQQEDDRAERSREQ